MTPVFVHLKKTAGTSLKSLVVKNYGEGRVFLSQNPEFDRNAIRAGIQFHNNDPDKFFTSYDAFAGHFPLKDYIVPHNQPLLFFSVVRHPVLRRMSDWNYVLRTPEHPFYELGQSMTFLDFLEFDNQASGQCAGLSIDGENTFNSVCSAMTAFAQKEKSRVILGVMERLDQLVEYLALSLRWKHSEIPHENVRTNDVPYYLSLKEARRVCEVDSEDVKLYRRVRDARHEVFAN